MDIGQVSFLFVLGGYLVFDRKARMESTWSIEGGVRVYTKPRTISMFLSFLHHPDPVVTA